MTAGDAAASGTPDGPLTILCGSGDMPLEVARAAAARGRDLFMLGIAGEADTAIEDYPHRWISYAEVSQFFEVLKTAGSTDLVIIGRVRRPDIKEFRFDLRLVRLLPKVLLTAIGNDNSILSTIVRVIESKGIRVHGAHEVAPDLLLGPGTLGKARPNRQDRADIALARTVLADLGAHDIGQAVVVRKGRIVAVEASEGTDSMLQRCIDIAARHRDSGGVLVKLPKPGQEMRVDMPTIGPATVEAAARARLNGVAAIAGQTLVAGRQALREAANRTGLFVAGLEPEQAGAGR